ncbi:hypothetical protein BH23CHL2_BH23CHL2_23760 [soil metagenome]
MDLICLQCHGPGRHPIPGQSEGTAIIRHFDSDQPTALADGATTTRGRATVHRSPPSQRRMKTPDPGDARKIIRRDSHIALGCGFGLALLIVGALAILLLAGV